MTCCETNLSLYNFAFKVKVIDMKCSIAICELLVAGCMWHGARRQDISCVPSTAVMNQNICFFVHKIIKFMILPHFVVYCNQQESNRFRKLIYSNQLNSKWICKSHTLFIGGKRYSLFIMSFLPKKQPECSAVMYSNYSIDFNSTTWR